MNNLRIPDFMSFESTDDGFVLRARLKCPVSEARCLAVAAASWVREAAGNGASILWPNHVVQGDRRVCGITCRASGEEIVFTFKPLREAVSLTFEEFRDRVLACAVRDLDNYPDDREDLMRQYCEHCGTIMKFVNITYRGMPLYGFAFAIDKHGGLMVMTQESRTVVTVYGGEAEIVRRGEEPVCTPDLPVTPRL